MEKDRFDSAKIYRELIEQASEEYTDDFEVEDEFNCAICLDLMY